MSYINDEQKEQIIAFTNANTSNNEISNILGIPLQTIFYWKRKLRQSGEIIAEPSRTGRQPITYHICDKCGSKVKDLIPKVATSLDRQALLKEKRDIENKELEDAENFLKKKYGEETPLPKKAGWNYGDK